MPDERQHPDPQQLAAFNLGQLEPEAAVAIERHVGQCQRCCETLLEMGAEDTFVGLLRDATPAPGEETVAIPAPLARHPRYEIAGLIARGGMGDVFRAEHRVMERTVALKIIRPQLVRNAEAVARFHREVKTAAQLSHPNIVAAYDADRSGDVHFLVMEYVEGTNLAELVTRRGRLPVGEACDYIRQAAVGLQYAHERGMVHRDIKPHNLMVSGGRVKILDFGLASLAAAWGDAETLNYCPEEWTEDGASGTPRQAESRLTYAGAILGTPDFLSPEQCRDAGSADIRSDIYSLGCTLYYLLAGRPPFPGNTILEKLKAHEERDPAPLPDDVSPALEQVVRRMMAKDPGQRHQSPSEVAQALAPFFNVAATEGLRPARRWGSWAIRLATALAAVVLLGVVLYFATDAGTLVVQSPTDEGSPSSPSPSRNQALAPVADSSVAAPPAPGPSPAVASSEEICPLYFKYNHGRVALPDELVLDRGPLTVELRVTPHTRTKAVPHKNLVSLGDLEIRVLRGTDRSLKWNVVVAPRDAGRVDLSLEAPWPVAPEVPGPTHLAVVRDEGQLKLFVDGRLAAEKPYVEDLDFSYHRWFGNRAFEGTIGEARISSVARYTGDFASPSPIDRPTERFEPDEHTAVLYHFESASAGFALDSSGNGFHGEIVNGDWIPVEEAPDLAAAASLVFDGANHALYFGTNPAGVTLPELPLNEDGPYTIELWATCCSRPEDQRFLVTLGQLSLKIHRSNTGLSWTALVSQTEDDKAKILTALHRNWAWAPWFPGPTHLAFARDDGGMLRLFVDGRLVAQKPFQDVISLPAFPTIGGEDFDGTIDEVRISSVARYTENFTPQLLWDRFQPDEHTVALYHFDEGSGRVALDSSGAGLHGEIVGGEWRRLRGSP